MEEASASTPNGAVLPVPQVQPPPSGQAAESAQPMQQAQQAQQLEELAAGPLGAAPAVNTSAPGEGVTTAPCAVPLGYIPPPSASPGTSMAQPPGGIPAAAQPPGAAPLAGAPGCALPGSAPQGAWQPGSMAQAGMAPGSMPHGGLPAGALPPGTMQPVGTSGGLLPVGTLPFGPFPQFGAAGRQGMPVPPGMPPGSAVPGPGGNYIVGAVTTRLTVTVPAGISGGELVRVAAPDGSYHSVMVPAGLSAGQQFSVELLAGPADGSSVELNKLRVELEAERHLRRETQQEALRTRQALEAIAGKRRADVAVMHEMLKRHRRCIEHLTAQLGTS